MVIKVETTCNLGQEFRISPEIPGPERPGIFHPEHEAPETSNQTVTVDGSILTPGPMVEEIATRLT